MRLVREDVGHESDSGSPSTERSSQPSAATACSSSGRRSLMAAILIPLAVMSGLQFAFLLFVLVMGYGLLAVPQLRRRSAAEMQKSTKSWKLRPE